MKKHCKSLAPSLSRGLEVLEALTEDPYEMTLPELSEKLGIPSASLWRISRVLSENGYVIFDRNRRTYRLGFKLLHMGNYIFSNGYFRSEGRKHLKSLADLTGETAELDVRIRDQLVLVDQVRGTDSVYLYSNPGSSIPYFHATAPGKIYLAQLEEQKLLGIVERMGLPRLTEHTIQDMGKLQKEIEDVRINGYAVDIEEMREGVARIAAPVYESSGLIKACIAVVCPAFKLNDRDKIFHYGELLKRTAHEMSRQYMMGI